jgi:hypothetical protein
MMDHMKRWDRRKFFTLGLNVCGIKATKSAIDELFSSVMAKT